MKTFWRLQSIVLMFFFFFLHEMNLMKNNQKEGFLALNPKIVFIPLEYKKYERGLLVFTVLNRYESLLCYVHVQVNQNQDK